MDLTVEISLDLITCKNIVTTINTIKNIIENNNAYYNFSFYETAGCRKIERNEYINSIIFEDKNDLLNFLKEIKFLKNIRIDCIYYSNSIEYLYISKRYAKINNIKNVKSIYNNSLNIENILNIK